MDAISKHVLMNTPSTLCRAQPYLGLQKAKLTIPISFANEQ